MKINHCPIEFHDLVEISEFLQQIPSPYNWMFDGCTVSLGSCLIMFYYLLVDDILVLTYKTIYR